MRGKALVAACCVAAAQAFVPLQHTTTTTGRLASPFGDQQQDRVRAFEARTGQKVFEALVEYPCDFPIKIIGREDETFVEDVLRYISRETRAAAPLAYTTNPSSKGTYVSVTVTAPVQDADMLYRCYAVLRNDPRVKIAL